MVSLNSACLVSRPSDAEHLFLDLCVTRFCVGKGSGSRNMLVILQQYSSWYGLAFITLDMHSDWLAHIITVAKRQGLLDCVYCRNCNHWNFKVLSPRLSGSVISDRWGMNLAR